MIEFVRPFRASSVHLAPSTGITSLPELCKTVGRRIKAIINRAADMPRSHVVTKQTASATMSSHSIESASQADIAQRGLLRRAIVDIREADIARCARIKQWSRDVQDQGKEVRLTMVDGQLRMKVREYRGINPIKHLREPSEYAHQVQAMRAHLEATIGYPEHRPVKAWAMVQMLSERIACSGTALDRLDNPRSSGKSFDADAVREHLTPEFKMAFGRPLTFLE